MRKWRGGHRLPLTMRRRWRYVLVFSLLVLGMLLWVKWHQFFLDHSKEVPEYGGIYTEATVGTVVNLNPLSPSSSFLDRDIQQLIFAGLLRYNPVTKEFEEDLATLNIVDPGEEFELTLKDDVKFSNGDTVDIADVMFTYETLLQNPNFGNKDLQQAFAYTEISVVDGQTVSFKLPEQNMLFMGLLTTPILPQKSFEGALIEEVLDPDYPYNRKPIGAGPFRLKNVIPEDRGFYRVFLEANPHYHHGKPYLEQAVLYGFRTSEQLVYSHNWPSVFTRIPWLELNNFETQLFGEYKRFDYNLPRYTGLFFNLDKEVMNRPTFREALARALPVETILEPGWKEIRSPFFNDSARSYPEALDYQQGRILLRDNGFPYDREREVRTIGKDGDPARFTLLTSTVPPVYSRFAQKLKNAWEDELLFEIDLQILPPAKFQTALKERNYDMVLFGQNFSDNFDTLSSWHSSQSGRLNLANLTREDIDFLIDEIRFSGAGSDYQALQDELDTLKPALIFATPDYGLLASTQLKGFNQTWGEPRSLAHRFVGSEKWHFKTKLDWDWPVENSKISSFFKWWWTGSLQNKIVDAAPEEENIANDLVDSEETAL